MKDIYLRDIRRGFEIVYDIGEDTFVVATVKWGGHYASHTPEQARQLASRICRLLNEDGSMTDDSKRELERLRFKNEELRGELDTAARDEKKAQAEIRRLRAELSKIRMTEAEFQKLDKPGNPISETDVILIMRELHNARAEELAAKAEVNRLSAELANQQVTHSVAEHDNCEDHYRAGQESSADKIAKLRAELAEANARIVAMIELIDELPKAYRDDARHVLKLEDSK